MKGIIKKMTFEELKAEATSQGYTLVKSKPYVPHIKCSCGRRGQLWQKYDTEKFKELYRIRCTGCDNKTDWNTTKYDAWKEWYQRGTGC